MIERHRLRGVLAAAVLACSALVAPVATANSAPQTSAAPTSTPGAGSPSSDLQTYVNDMVRTGIPGAIAELDRGGRRTTATRGIADRITGQPLSLADRFRIASQTKVFVATVVLQLVAEHKVALNTPIAHYLPGLVQGGKAITVRMLLDHTAGLFDAPDSLVQTLKDLWHVKQTTYTPQQLVALADAHGLLFPPGSRWAYSNTDYIVLGLLVESVEKQPIASVLQRRIFDPLRMTQTSFVSTDPNLPKPFLHGYLAYDNDRLFLEMTRFDESFIWAAGAGVSTVGDLGTFQRALFSGRLLPPRLLREMEQPVSTGQSGLGYGLGVEEITLPCGTAIGHNGLLPGFASASYTLEGTTTSVRVVANWYTSTPAALQSLYATALGSLCGISPSAAPAVLHHAVSAAATARLR